MTQPNSFLEVGWLAEVKSAELSERQLVVTTLLAA